MESQLRGIYGPRSLKVINYQPLWALPPRRSCRSRAVRERRKGNRDRERQRERERERERRRVGFGVGEVRTIHSLYNIGEVLSFDESSMMLFHYCHEGDTRLSPFCGQLLTEDKSSDSKGKGYGWP